MDRKDELIEQQQRFIKENLELIEAYKKQCATLKRIAIEIEALQLAEKSEKPIYHDLPTNACSDKYIWMSIENLRKKYPTISWRD